MLDIDTYTYNGDIMKTRVAKIIKEETIDIFDEDVPALADGQVLVKLKSVGICGSDMHFFRHCGLGSFKNPLPIDIGHEPAGIVVDSKSNLYKTDDRVVIEPGLNCNKCYYCHQGLHHLCEQTKFLGANDIGAFRDFIILEPERLMKIDDDVSYEKAALLEPVGVALHAVDRVNVKLNKNVAILGSGTIGLLILSVLKKSGCAVSMFDPLPHRLDFARDVFEADEISLNCETQNLNNFKNKFDIVFDAVGVQDSLDKAIKLIKPTGEICIVGIPEVDQLKINPHQMRIKEITLTNSRRSNQKLGDSYKIFRHDNKVEKLVTHRFKLEDIQKAFEISSNYLDSSIKVMIME